MICDLPFAICNSPFTIAETQRHVAQYNLEIVLEHVGPLNGAPIDADAYPVADIVQNVASILDTNFGMVRGDARGGDNQVVAICAADTRDRTR